MVVLSLEVLRRMKRLCRPTLVNPFVDQAPENRVGDKAYGIDKLDTRLDQKRGIEVITPHQIESGEARYSDGRKVAVLSPPAGAQPVFAWLRSYRRWSFATNTPLAAFLTSYNWLACSSCPKTEMS